MAITRQKKEEVISQIREKIDKAQSVIITDYKGLAVDEINELRNKLREKEVEYKVVKFTLLRLALKQVGFDKVELGDFEAHPIALAFGYKDEVETAKTVYEFTKEHEMLDILGGISGRNNVSVDTIINLALLPSREELYTKLVGSINAPLSGLVNVLSGNLRGLVSVLGQYREQVSNQ